MASNHRRRRLNRFFLESALVSAERLESRELLAVGVQNVASFNLLNPWGRVTETEAVGNQLYFAAAEPNSTNLDLWRSDGTTAGTIRLTSLGPDDSQPRHLTNMNGTLFFRGHSVATGHELWQSNGTVAGTSIVRDLRAGAASSTISELVSFNGMLLFNANGDLFRTNGTSAGTVRVKDLFASASDDVSMLEQVGNAVYFRAKSLSTGFDLYRTNGTNAGTSKVQGITGAAISNLTNVAGRLYFTEGRNDLWTTTPGEANASEIFGDAIFGQIDELTDVSGRLFFTRGPQLFQSDGTPNGTTEVSGVTWFSYDLFNGNGTLLFSSGDGSTQGGAELWRSDGTPSGTFMVKDINPAFDEGYLFGSYPRSFTNASGRIFFMASDSVEPESLWMTDGTNAGTINVERGGAAHLTNVNGALMFFRETSGGGIQLHRLANGAASSVTVSRNGPGTGSSNPSTPVVLNGQRYLFADDGVSGTELRRWRSNGTLETVAHITPGPKGTIASQIVIANGLLYFSVMNPTSSHGLWRSDGTAAGTFRLSGVQVPALHSNQASSGSSVPFTNVNGTLYFTGIDSSGTELWKTNGTVAGTITVKDIFPGFSYSANYGSQPHSSFPDNLTNLNGTLYFSAFTKENGRELWKSDGTTAGTVLFADLFANDADTDPEYPQSSNVSGITNRNGTLVFAARSSDTWHRFWSSDGTSAGTVPMTAPIPNLSHVGQWVNLNGQMLFTDGGDGLWTTNFTTAGTRILRDMNPLSSWPRIQHLTVHENLLYFSASNGIHGVELWRSNGTTAGTFMARDLNSVVDPNSSQLPSSNPAEFTSLNGVLFFTADDGRSGREIWYTNGRSGVSKVTEVSPGAVGSDPTGLTVWKNSILFAANSATAGRELFRTFALPPAITLTDSVVTWTEGDPAIRIGRNAVLTDADTPIFNGGRLSVTIANPVAGDLVSLPAGEGVAVAGTSVVYNSGIFGTIDRASTAAKLIVNLNLNAGRIAVERLIRTLSFHSTSDNPTARDRVIRVTLEDGTSGVKNVFVRVHVVPVNDRPTVSGLAGNVAYQRDSNPGVSFAANAVVTDLDNVRIAGGTLTVQALFGDTAANRLMITGALFSITADGNLLHSGVVIGTVNADGGTGATPLIVTFNSAGRVSHAQQLLRALKFRTVGSSSTVQRQINIHLSDGSGGLSDTVSVILIIMHAKW